MRASAHIVIGFFGAALLASQASAQAQLQTGVVYSSDQAGIGAPPPYTGQLSIPVTAQVTARCGFAQAPNGSVNQPDFDVNGIPQTDFAFQLECSGPSRVAITSQNGGLLTNGTVPTGYTTLAPYNVELNVVANDSNDNVNDTCAAAELNAGNTCTFFGTASETVGAYVASPSVGQSGSYVRVSAPVYAGVSVLVDGTYSDILTVTLSAAP